MRNNKIYVVIELDDNSDIVNEFCVQQKDFAMEYLELMSKQTENKIYIGEMDFIGNNEMLKILTELRRWDIIEK